jgi:ketosteroid isomerase-like protein
VAYGQHGVIEQFRALLEEFPDWRVEPQEFVEGGADTLLVRNMGLGTGRGSGVPARIEFTQLWRFRAGRPVEVREYLDHSEALAAAGAA